MSRDDWLNNGLPTFDGVKDKPAARQMIDRLGGPQGFKTSYRNNPDGSVTILQLKGSMPPQLYSTGFIVTDPDPRGRTFVFNETGSSLGMISNRSGTLMKKVLYPYSVISNATYKVGPSNTSGNAKRWMDVWRLDQEKFLSNAKPAANAPSVVNFPTTFLAKTPVPWLVNYSPVSHEPSDRTALFTGTTEGEYYDGRHMFGMSGVAFDGTLIEQLTLPDEAYSYSEDRAMGVSISNVGEFRFYWMVTTPTYVSHYAVMLASVSGPPELISHEASDSLYTLNGPRNISVTGSISTAYENVVSCLFSETMTQLEDAGIITIDGHDYHQARYTYSGDGVGYYGTELMTTNSQIACSEAYTFYPETALQMNLNISIAGTSVTKEFTSGLEPTGLPYDGYWRVGSEGQWMNFDKTCETVVDLSLGGIPLTKVQCTLHTIADMKHSFSMTITYPPMTQYVILFGSAYPGDLFEDLLTQRNIDLLALNRDRYGNHHAPFNEVNQQISYSDVQDFSISHDICTLILESNDYLFLDVDEDISLRLNAVYNYHYDHTGESQTGYPQYPPDICRLSVKYVLDVRGDVIEFQVYDGDFTEPQLSISDAGDLNNSGPRFRGYMHPGGYIYPTISAPMEQGKCAWIAYTTKAEEAAGATPEFYIDAAVRPDSNAGKHSDAMGDPWIFNPLQLGGLFTNYLGYWADSSPTGIYNTVLFGKTTRIQYAKGISNPWPEKLGEPFTAESHVKISRI